MIIFLAIPPNQVWVGKQTMRRKPHNNAIIGAFTLKLEISFFSQKAYGSFNLL